MTLVSNNPSWWPVIDWYHQYSYFLGMWRADVHLPRSMSDRGFTVVSSTVLAYDWGEQDIWYLRRELLMSVWYYPALTFGQEVGGFKLLPEQTLTTNCFAAGPGLGERSPISKVQ